jgi:hypothetical protein
MPGYFDAIGYGPKLAASTAVVSNASATGKCLREDFRLVVVRRFSSLISLGSKFTLEKI